MGFFGCFYNGEGAPGLLFSWGKLSCFHEVNLRTYVIRENKPGVYFLNIEANNRISCYLATILSGLRYQYQEMRRTGSNAKDEMFSFLFPKTKSLPVQYQILSENSKDDKKSKLDIFLTEKYCLYNEEKNRLFRFEVYHNLWELIPTYLCLLDVNYTVGNINLSQFAPALVHYSPGVKVNVWGKERI